MDTSMSHMLGTNSFSPLLPPPVSSRTVFDNGVEADISAITDRRALPRDDRELLGDVTRALREATNVPQRHLLASVRDGIVTLEGRTSFYYERAAAECAVRFLTGVRSVENRIMVEPPTLAHEVRICIAEALKRSAAHEATRIAVQAVGGTVILQGVVHSQAERDVAEHAARTVEGVRSVIDNIIVSA